MNKQLELDLSCTIDQRDKIKKEIKNNIENGNYTLDELESIYRHIYVSTQKFKPLQKRLGHVYFLCSDSSKELCNTAGFEITEQNSKIYKIGKSNTNNVINRISEQISDKNQILAVSNLMKYEMYSKLERDLHQKYSKNRIMRSERFIGLQKHEINEIKKLLGGGISVKELRHL